MDNIRYGRLNASDEEVIMQTKDQHILLLNIYRINMKQRLPQKDRI